MKTFLNVVGILAILGSFFAWLGGGTAVAQVEGAIGMLLGCTCLGFAYLIELHVRAKTEHGKRLDDALSKLHDALAELRPRPAALPPVPGFEKYHVSYGADVHGPINLESVRDLYERKRLTRESYILKEGDHEWRRLESVLE